MTPIYKTIQDRETDPIGLFPWLYAHPPGQIFIVEYKKAGRVVRTKRWKLIEPPILGAMRFWTPLWEPPR